MTVIDKIARTVVVAFAMLGAAQPCRSQSGEAKPLRLPLKRIKVVEGEYRPGLEVVGSIGSEAFEARLDNRRLRLFDLDGDGVITPGLDGLGLPEEPFVVSLPERLLLFAGQYRVSIGDDDRLELAPEDFGERAALVVEVALVNELRIRAGRPLAVFDLEASIACEKHCDYLQRNGRADGDSGMSAHEERPGEPGYSEEGARAGRGSCLGFKTFSYREVLLGWYATSWHAAPLLAPEMRSFGAARRHGVAMFYPATFGGAKKSWIHPADGARNIPRSFSPRGELPNPVPGTEYGRGCGYPIFVFLADPGVELVDVTVRDAKGRTVEGSWSCPSRPANPDWPSNSSLALFIPKAPLRRDMRYDVSFKLGSGDLDWSFRTESKKAR